MANVTVANNLGIGTTPSEQGVPSNAAIGGTIASGTRKFVRTGNKILVQIGGITVGLCQSVDCQEDMSPEPASGIGDISVVEWVPTMARYTVHIEEMVLNAGSLRGAGVTPGTADDVLKGNVFDLVFVATGDLGESGLARVIKSCSYASGSVQIRKHAIVISSAVFNAIGAVGTGF